MNLFSLFGRGAKPDAEAAAPHERLPAINSFVDIAVGGSSRRESLAVNDITKTMIVTRCAAGFVADARADFVYANAAGRFRFVTTCAKVEGDSAFFRLPKSIKVLDFYAHRGTARVNKVVPVEWRYAPDCAGYGEYMLSSMMDISVGGASLVVDRVLKVSTKVEVRIRLGTPNTTFTELCEVVRVAKIEASAKNAVGIRFLAMAPENEKTLMKYLHDLQMERRDRGFI